MQIGWYACCIIDAEWAVEETSHPSSTGFEWEMAVQRVWYNSSVDVCEKSPRKCGGGYCCSLKVLMHAIAGMFEN